jgi:aspartate/methionine/tyrosine aminotransferase
VLDHLEHSPVLETIPGASRGAMFVLVRSRGRSMPHSTATALDVIRETGVALVPGAAFGACGEGWLRLSFAGAPGPVLQEALGALDAFFAR